jgi:signal transduction histidine kinase
MTIHKWSFFLIIFGKKILKKYLSLLLFYCCFMLIISCKQDKISRLNSNLFQNEVYRKCKKESKIQYLDSLYRITNNFTNDSILKSFLFDLSAEYYYLNYNKKSFAVCKKILVLSAAVKDTFSIAKAYSYIGDTHQISQKDSAYYYYHKSEKLYRILNNRNQIGKMLFKKAYILFFEGNYIESEAEVSNALLYLKNCKDPEMLYAAYSLMGLNFEKMDEYESALKYLFIAKSILKDIKGNNSNLEKQYIYGIESSINISNVYEKKHQYDKSIQELQAVLSPILKEKWIQGYESVLGNLGYSMMKSGNIKGVEKLFNEALSSSKKNGTDEDVIYKLLNLGEFYFILKDSVRSTSYLKQSLALAEKLKMGEETKKSLQLLSQIDRENSAIYDKRYIAITDSLEKAQRISRNKYARIEYETATVEEENKVLNAKNTYILLGSLLIIFALVLVLIYRYIKNQKREIEFRISQQKAEEEIFELFKEYQLKLSITKELEQNRISKELHDGVMNRLYGARMQLGIWNESDTKEAKEKRLIYVDLLQEIELEIRSISHDLRSEIVDNHLDFMSLLLNLIQLQNEIGETVFVFETPSEIDWDIIDSVVKITLFRIVQECLLNVTKHANAKECRVTISIVENKLIMQIQDNGAGFDILATKQGIGLTNIQERAEKIKAQLTISSAPNVGTTILMKVKIGSL